MCVFGLKNDLFREKRQNHNFLLKKYDTRYFSILWKHLHYGLTVFSTIAILWVKKPGWMSAMLKRAKAMSLTQMDTMKRLTLWEEGIKSFYLKFLTFFRRFWWRRMMATRMVSNTRVRRRQMRMGMSTSVSGFDSTKSSQGRLHFLSFAENRVLLNILPVLLAISSVIFTAVYFLMVTCVDRGPLSHLIFFLSLQYHDLHYFNKFSVSNIKVSQSAEMVIFALGISNLTRDPFWAMVARIIQ